MNRVHEALSELDRQVARIKIVKGIQPWSQESYIQRARSFHWSWASRPLPADVTTCARYGWWQPSHDEYAVNTIKCTACGASLYLPWDDDLLPDARKGRPEITTLHFTSRLVEMKAFRERIETLKSLNNIIISASEDKSLWKLVDLIKSTKHLPDDTNVSMILLALLQWKFANNSLICTHGCSELPSSVLDAEFDPISAHSWFCPTVQESSWMALLDLFKDRGKSYLPLLSQFTCNRIEELFE